MKTEQHETNASREMTLQYWEWYICSIIAICCDMFSAKARIKFKFSRYTHWLLFSICTSCCLSDGLSILMVPNRKRCQICYHHLVECSKQSSPFYYLLLFVGFFLFDKIFSLVSIHSYILCVRVWASPAFLSSFSLFPVPF